MPTTGQPPLQFTATESRTLTAAAREVVRAAAQGEWIRSSLPDELADLQVLGMFVTLKRAGQLRGCLGRWNASGQLQPLGPLLDAVAQSTAVDDVRFPRICPAECDALSISLSLMYDTQPLPAEAKARVQGIQVGKHGLHISNPLGRGILLPIVAVEQGWDEQTFLEHVCLKAQLPRDAWKSPESEMESFQTIYLEAEATAPGLDPKVLTKQRLQRLAVAARYALADQKLKQAHDPVLEESRPEQLGIVLGTKSGRSVQQLGQGESLLDLTLKAAQTLRKQHRRDQEQDLDLELKNLVVLTQAIDLVAADHPHRHLALASYAVLVRGRGRWHLDAPAHVETFAMALAKIDQDEDTWRCGETQVTAFQARQIRLGV